MGKRLHISLVGIVKVGASIIEPHTVFHLNLLDKLGLGVLLLEELCESVVGQPSIHLVFALGSETIALMLTSRGRDALLLVTTVDLGGNVFEALLSARSVGSAPLSTFLVPI